MSAIDDAVCDAVESAVRIALNDAVDWSPAPEHIDDLDKISFELTETMWPRHYYHHAHFIADVERDRVVARGLQLGSCLCCGNVERHNPRCSTNYRGLSGTRGFPTHIDLLLGIRILRAMGADHFTVFRDVQSEHALQFSWAGNGFNVNL